MNNIYPIEYAIKNKDKTNLKKILQKNPKEANNIRINTLLELIHFNEFDFFIIIIKSLNKNDKKILLSKNEIINELLDSDNLKFIKKYSKYISLNEHYLLNLCISDKINLKKIKLIYQLISLPKDYSLLGTLIYKCLKDNIKINLELVKLLIKLNKNIINEKYNNKPILGCILLINNIELLEILKDAGIKFYYDNYNIFNDYIYNIDDCDINNDIILFLLNNNINLNLSDSEFWLPAHNVFFKPEIFTLEIKKIILEKTNNINQQNTLGNTVLHYLIMYDDINNYKDILIKKELDIFINNKASYTPLSIAQEKKVDIMDIVAESFINQTNKKNKNKKDIIQYILDNKISIYNKKIENNDIIIGDYQIVNHNKYNSMPINIQLYILILLQKYDFIGIPYLPTNDITIIKKKIYNDEIFDDIFKRHKKYLFFCKEFMYIKIYWGDENNFYITPEIGKAINYIFKFKKYAFMFIHISNKQLDSAHANILIFDKEKKLIIHFEPHGYFSFYIGKFYETLKKHFHKELPKYKYISPFDYLPKKAYQTMYNEQNLYNRTIGDLQGYCSAWCFWFLELYINNNKYNLKCLVSKSIKKLINTKYTFFEHIRNYANYLNNKSSELLLNYGVFYNYINIIMMNDITINSILKYISTDIKKLIN